MSHNGEINTCLGNMNWMNAREGAAESPFFDDISQLFPVIEPNCSDSGVFDSVLEFLVMNNQSLPEGCDENDSRSLAKRFEYVEGEASLL